MNLFDDASHFSRTTTHKTAAPIPDFGTGKFTITLWVKTASDGPLLAKTAQGGGGGLNKLLFLRGGQVHYDISNLGCVRGRATIADGRWHHVALCGGAPQLIYVDGLLDAHGILEQMPDPKGIARVLLFGGAAGWLKGVLNGQLDDVRLYHRVLSAREISEQAKSSEPQSSQGTLSYLRLRRRQQRCLRRTESCVTRRADRLRVGQVR